MEESNQEKCAMEIPKKIRYTKEHEWVLLENDTALVGITDYAQQHLGDVVFVELPEIGTGLRKGEVFCVVESVKAASDVYAPMSGEVLEINETLEDHPEILNQSPYEKGWIVKIRVDDGTEYNDLMKAEDYEQFIEKEEE
jgi:glycine cleavage system H protein